MSPRIRRRLLLPAAIPLGVAAVVAAIIITIGEALLGMAVAHPESELQRPELWGALIGALAIIGLGAFAATRPAGSTGILEREVVIGTKPFYHPEPPPVDESVRRGPLGTVSDIREGDMLYARNGPLARVRGVLPGEEEFGRMRRGILYAQGVYGASDELWIPVEAVLAVYPETHTVFLAIKGDETEHFGWNRPPESFRRTPPRTSLH